MANIVATKPSGFRNDQLDSVLGDLRQYLQRKRGRSISLVVPDSRIIDTYDTLTRAKFTDIRVGR